MHRRVPGQRSKGRSLFLPSPSSLPNSFAVQLSSTPNSPTYSSLPRPIEGPRRSGGSSFPSTAKRSSIAAAFAQLILNVFLSEALKSRTDLSGERLSRLHRVVVPRLSLESRAISKVQKEAEEEWQKEDGRGREEETSRRALEASQFFSGIY